MYFCPLDLWKLRKCADSFFFITSPYFAWRLNFAQFCLILQLSAEVGENLFPLMFAFSIFMGGSHYFQKLNQIGYHLKAGTECLDIVPKINTKLFVHMRNIFIIQFVCRRF